MVALKKNGYLILNTGTPDEPTIPALRRYLKEFLSDPDMLDYPSSRPKELSRGFDKIKNILATVNMLKNYFYFGSKRPKNIEF